MEKLRPMTQEESHFATVNHPLVYAFLREKDLPEDVFYDIVIFGYIRAVQDYLSKPRFLVYAFSTVAWKQMQNSLTGYSRYRNTSGRFGETVGLTDPIRSTSELRWEDVLTERNSGLLDFETRELLREMDEKLPLLEMKIIRMKLAGCKMHEIAGREHLTFREINTLLADCKDDIVRILWGDDIAV